MKKGKIMKYVVYQNDNETIVCTKKMEQEMLDDLFRKSYGRDIENYDRSVVKDNSVWLSSSIRVE